MKLQHVLLPDWNRILQSMETPVYCKLNVDEDVTTFEVFFYSCDLQLYRSLCHSTKNLLTFNGNSFCPRMLKFVRQSSVLS